MDTSIESDRKESVIYQLQYLMAQLSESEKLCANPAEFCHAFKDVEGKPTNVSVQDDSGGFYTRLVDKVNESLKNTPFKNVFRVS